MLGTIFIGLSGMAAYSKGLDVISNNVANLNTPGFKLTDPSFSDALYQNGEGAIAGSSGTPTGGAGVSVDTGRASFRQGEMRDTGNPLDAGVEGNGFFVLDRNGEQLFTRAGQFAFDPEGRLIERTTGARVLVSGDGTSLATFDLDEYRSDPPKATTEVSLTGTLSRSGTATYDLANIPVIDASGTRHTLKAKFVRDSANPLGWTVEITDSSNAVIGRGAVKFNADGTPAGGSNTVSINVKPAELPEFAVVLNLGAADRYAGVSSIATATAASQLNVLRQNGVERGALSSTTFDDHGRLTLQYSNGQKKTPATLLLAQFDTSENLHALGNGLYTAKAGVNVVLATAQTEGRGSIVGNKLEMSNVDLTQQFTDLIIIQRGYQASSQMTSVANEMIQQLLGMGKGQ